MDPSASSPSHGNDDPAPAPDRPPVFGLFVLMIATAAFVTLSGLGVKTLLAIRADAEITSKTRQDPELTEIRASARAALDRYEVVDAAKDQYQVPVTRAMEMVVRDPSLLAPVAEAPPLAPTPAAAATPAAAPEAMTTPDAPAEAAAGEQ